MADAIKVHVYDDATLLGTVNVSGGNWSKTGQNLAAGDHKIKGKAEDLAGNVGAFSSIKNITAGSSAIPQSPDLLDDSGESSSDNVTNDSTPQIKVHLDIAVPSGASGLASNTVKKLKLKKWNGSVYQDYLELTSGLNYNTVDGWVEGTFQVVTALGEGQHQFAACWVDQKDNESAMGDPLTITVDTTAPNAPAITNIQDGQVFVGTSIDISGTAT